MTPKAGQTSYEPQVTELDNGRLRFDFLDLPPIEDEVRIQGQDYVLREADNKTAVAYRNAILSAANVSDSGKITGIGGVAKAEPVLLAGCLFRKNTLKGTGDVQLSPVLVSWVESLPNRIVQPLFKRAKYISGLDAGRDTPESLAKKIAELERKRKDLLGAGGESDGDSDPKGTPGSTPGTSD